MTWGCASSQSRRRRASACWRRSRARRACSPTGPTAPPGPRGRSGPARRWMKGRHVMGRAAGATGDRVILIAEDEPPIADLVAEVVADLGCTPLLAGDGRRALELARERRPALLITDLMMPYVSGAQLIAALRAEAAAT